MKDSKEVEGEKYKAESQGLDFNRISSTGVIAGYCFSISA